MVQVKYNHAAVVPPQAHNNISHPSSPQPIDYPALEAQQQEIRATQATRVQQQQQHAEALGHYQQTNHQAAAQLHAYEQQVKALEQRKAEAAREMQHYEDHGREKRKAAEAARNFAQKVLVYGCMGGGVGVWVVVC